MSDSLDDGVWIAIAASDELAAGDARPVSCEGYDLVLFRTASGVALVLDAYCAHLGAHLGYGGRVVGERLRCPFHGWCWDSAGACVQIPYSRRIPDGARLPAWPVDETNGLIRVRVHYPTSHGDEE